MKHWNITQLENFLRHETMLVDASCKKLARKLHKDGLINLLVNSDPNDYDERIE